METFDDFGLVPPEILMDPLSQYRRLEVLLKQTRIDGDPEDEILDCMDEMWYQLSDTEREILNNEPMLA